jgi:tripartite-type tricarboxylate transporter receptor subunit TctC
VYHLAAVAAPFHPFRLTHLQHAIAALLLLCGAGAGASASDAFPRKAVRIVVPYPAGGSSDIVGRILSSRLAAAWGQPAVVENVPGNRSTFGTHEVALAEADGHTLLVANSGLAINEVLSRKLPYHPLRDFAPISLIVTQQFALVVGAQAGYASLAQLVDAAQTKSRPISYGSSGHGSIGHLAGELFRIVTGGALTHVAYRSTRQALRELASKHVTCAMLPLATVIPEQRAGRLKVLAVTGSRRAEVLPDVPALSEQFAGYDVKVWVGVLAPYGASVSLVRKINSDLTTIVRTTGVADMLTALGYDVVGSTPGEFQTRLAADIERYSRIVTAAGLGGQ